MKCSYLESPDEVSELEASARLRVRTTATIHCTINLFTACFLDNASVTLGSAEESHFVNCLLRYYHREDFELAAHVLELGRVHLHE